MIFFSFFSTSHVYYYILIFFIYFDERGGVFIHDAWKIDTRHY